VKKVMQHYFGNAMEFAKVHLSHAMEDAKTRK